MNYWEYKIVQLRTDGSYKESAGSQSAGNINDLGRLGWELDKVLNWQGAEGWVVFRRELMEDLEEAGPDYPPSEPAGDIRNLIDPRS